MKATNRLRVVRAEKRVTQEAIEAKSKNRISQTRISIIENEADEATEAEKRLLAKILKTPVHEIFPEPDNTSAVAS